MKTKLKKILSLAASMSIISTMLVTTASAEDVTKAHTLYDFEAYTDQTMTGSIYSSCWSWEAPSNDPGKTLDDGTTPMTSYYVKPAVVDAGHGTSLSLTRKTSAGTLGTNMWSGSGKANAYYNFDRETRNNTNKLQLEMSLNPSSDGTVLLRMGASNGSNIDVRIAEMSKGAWKFINQSGTEEQVYTYTPGQWYDAKWVIDMAAGTLDFYINGKLVKDNYQMWAAATETVSCTSLKYIHFAENAAGMVTVNGTQMPNTLYVDNVRATEYSAASAFIAGTEYMVPDKSTKQFIYYDFEDCETLGAGRYEKWGANSETTYNVLNDAEHGKYIKFYMAAGVKGVANIGYRANEQGSCNIGNISREQIDFSIFTEGGGFVNILNHGGTDNGAAIRLCDFGNDVSETGLVWRLPAADGSYETVYQTEKNKWYDARFILDTAADTYDFYLKGDNDTDYVLRASNRPLLKDGTTTKVDFQRVMQLILKTGHLGEGHGFGIDNVQFTVLDSLKAYDSTSIPDTLKRVRITVDGEIQQDAAENVVVYKNDELDTLDVISYDANTNAFTVELLSGVAVGDRFTVDFSGVMDAEIVDPAFADELNTVSFTIANSNNDGKCTIDGIYEHTDEKYSNGTKYGAFSALPADITTQNVRILNTKDKDDDVIIYEATYDASGKLINVAKIDKTLMPGANTVGVCVPTTGASKLKVFVWDADDSIRPVSGGFELK